MKEEILQEIINLTNEYNIIADKDARLTEIMERGIINLDMLNESNNLKRECNKISDRIDYLQELYKKL